MADDRGHFGPENYTDVFYDKDKLQPAQNALFQLLATLTVSMLYAHLIEEPLVQRIRKYLARFTSAPRIKLQ